jgi:2-oxoglutarate dehydrogenase E2 component (dihydrolipoamide succinyltransferase)
MEIKLSLITRDITEAVISEWLAAEGDYLKEGQDLLEIVTDKAAFDVPSPCDGILTKVIKEKGAEVNPEEVIAEIEINPEKLA